MGSTETHAGDGFPLTDEHRMLLRIRDTLYEGSWEDFARDLRARAEDRPHVFETVPVSSQMKATIASHLAMIDQMQGWEAEHDRTLSADDSADTAR
ncbi:MAG: hypothetical protein WBE26_01825 [Phycisphaerae bacterium]